MGHRRNLALTLIALMLVGALAGCVSSPSGSGNPAGDNTGGTGGTGGNGGGGGGGGLTEAQARSTYQSALDSLGSGGTAPNPMSMTMDIHVLNGSSSKTGTMGIYVDSDRSIMVMEVNGSAFAPNQSGLSIQAPTQFVIAQVGKTMFMGSPQDLYGFYNASQTPVSGLGSLSNSTSSGSAGLGFMNPVAILNASDAMPDGAQVSYKSVTYQGQSAIELTVDRPGATNGTVHLDTVVLTNPARVVTLDAEVVDTNASASDTLGNHYKVHMSFAYGSDASDPLLPGLLRMEAMTFTNSSSMGAGAFGSSGDKTWTIQPSIHPGSVALKDVTLQVRNASADPRNSTPILTLPLEQGSAENGVAKVTYTDVDGDGHVSPGDTITLHPKSQYSYLSISLYDEVSGMNLMPGFTLPSLVAALGAAVLVLRRRSP